MNFVYVGWAEHTRQRREWPRKGSGIAYERNACCPREGTAEGCVRQRKSQHDVSRTKRGFDGIVRLNKGEQIDSIRRWWQQDTILSDHKYARAEGC